MLRQEEVIEYEKEKVDWGSSKALNGFSSVTIMTHELVHERETTALAFTKTRGTLQKD